MLKLFLRTSNISLLNPGKRKKKEGNQLSASTFGALITDIFYLIAKLVMWESSSKCLEI